MKKLILLLFTINISLAQELKQNIRVSARPICLSIDTTANEGLIVTGGVNEYWTMYNCTPGNANAWVTKYDKNRNVIWSTCVGDQYVDTPSVIKQLPDGNIIVAWEEKYPVSGAEITYFAHLTKLSSEGEIVWSKSYYNRDVVPTSITDIIPYPDGSFLIAGKISSRFWISKIDTNSNILWERFGGGNGSIVSIKPTQDGGYISIGDDYHSSNVNVTKCSNPKGDSGDDVFIYKVDGNGMLQWQNCYGGSGYDNPYDIVQTTDGGYIFLASTLSTDYDIQNPKGGIDIWIVKINNAGSIVWSKCYGDTANEIPSRIFNKSNGNFLVCGTKTLGEYENPNDIWLFEIDNAGTTKWQYILKNRGEETFSFYQFYFGGDWLNRAGDFVFDEKRHLLNFATYQSTDYSNLWIGTIKIPECLPNISMNGTIDTSTSVDAKESITITGEILSPNKIELRASKYISLNPSMSVQSGSSFTAEIKNNCGAN